MTIDDILAMLDLGEDKQCSWLRQRGYGVNCSRCRGATVDNKESFADLAFRLRDEVIAIDGGVLFGRGLSKICRKLYDQKDYTLHEFLSWSTSTAQPIHWIAAALIAKQLAEKKD